MPSTISRSLRTDKQRQVDALLSPADVADRTEETCSYYPPDAGGCRAPRSCYDCLNAGLEKDSGGCVINKIGRCVSVANSYNFSLNLMLAVPVNDKVEDFSDKSSVDNVRQTDQQKKIETRFSAENTMYCEDNDVLFNKDQLTNVGFTYGTQGCVFVGACELPSWEVVVGGSECSGANPVDFKDPSDSDPRDNKGHSTFWCVAIAIILALVATLAMIITHHNRSKRRFEERQRRRFIVVAALITSSSYSMTPKCSKSSTRPLNLFGWEAMRTNLIENERRQMQERLGA